MQLSDFLALRAFLPAGEPGLARPQTKPSRALLAVAMAVLLGVTGGVVGAAETTAVPTDVTLEASGAIIRDIRINAQPIFDESKPGERTRLFRAANRLHIDTHDGVIRAQLLFKPGDRYSARIMRETERNLRQVRFLREPQIRVVAVDGKQVDLEVTTTDVWTLVPTFEFGRSGGRNKTSIGLQDYNFLGTGKSVELSYKDDSERTGKVLAYGDPNVLGSRWRMNFEGRDNSDGHELRFGIERPFFALDTENSYGLYLEDTDALARRYALGSEADIYRRQQSTLDVFVGRSQGLIGGWTLRHSLGLRIDDARFDAYAPGPTAALPPDDRNLRYPYYRFEAIEDDFATVVNRDLIGRTEDEAFGQRYMVELGYAGSAFGSDRNAAVVHVEASDGYRLPAHQSLFLRGYWSARVEGSDVIDSIFGVGARYFYRHGDHSTFYAALSADVGHQLDGDHDLLLGGDNGLRAYDVAFQSGEKRALLTVEQRYFTDWRVFQLFTVGAAVFADVGRVWGDNSIGAPSLGTVKDYGIGLRFGNLRSARANMLHIDLAWPVDDPFDSGPQIMVETRNTF